ncbi:hypothetical protein V8B55DRAFT_1473606 [Mucor lusitanicus]|uniref:Uncharacterized protein n=1 Tax=Mucor lusitanicus CBS 277.49 TaxID=747725 RepID=A0A168PE73_MUCCL|nr:hypothetical protein MUCCIDRAFT_104539 [Mucor lusitanicus CBS 277.49]
MKAEAINEVVMAVMVREPDSADLENIFYKVDSFTMIDQQYEVLVRDDHISDIQPYPVSNQTSNIQTPNSNNASFDDVIDRLASLLATCRVLRPANISEADINELSNHVNGISAILSREGQLLAPNTNFSTQGR